VEGGVRRTHLRDLVTQKSSVPSFSGRTSRHEYNNGSRSSALTAGAATSLNAELRPAARWRCQR
jgi:hypothetical protein